MLHVNKNGPEIYNIETLAKKTGLSRRAIRYYVQRGLIPRPEGGGRGHYYTAVHVERIKQIQKMSSQGVPLEAIKGFFNEHTEEEGVVLERAYQLEAAPLERSSQSRWIRINIGPDIEISVKAGRLSEEDLRAIEEFIRSRMEK